MTPGIFMKKVVRRLVWAIKGRPVQPDLLEMIWPEETLTFPPEINLAEGYHIRQFELSDTANYFNLFAEAGMEKPPLDYWEKHLLPGGFFIVEHEASGVLVAACFASHHPSLRHPKGGNLGWLAVHPAHRGRKLGQSVSAAVTSRLIAGGYRRIYLETHDYRLPAIAIYLKMGWVPLFYTSEMEGRWASIYQALKQPLGAE